MKPLRILLIIKNFEFGGAENHVRELANGLAASGQKVFVAGRKGKQQERLDENLSFIPFRFGKVFGGLNLFPLLRLVHREKIDLIHGHQRMGIHLASWLGCLSGVPVVATIHGRSQYDLRSWISRRIPSRFVFVSRFVLERSSRFPSIQSRCVWIPNGIDPNPEKAVPIPGQIAYCCRLDKRHATVLQLLIRNVLPGLLAEFPHLKLVVAGDGNFHEELSREAEAVNRRFGREVCRFLGYQEDTARLAASSSLFLGTGRVALEALAAGIPVLSVCGKRLGGIISPENFSFYRDNNFVAVGQPAPDADRLKDQIAGYFRNESEHRSDMGTLKERIHLELGIDRSRKELTKLYHSLISEK